MSLDELVADYLANPEFGGRTRDHYSRILTRLFLPYLAEAGLELAQVDQRVLNRWVVHLQQNGGPRQAHLSDHSIHSYSRAVNHFLSWARQAGEMRGTAKARAPRPDRKLLDVLSRREIQRLEDAAVAERDKLIIRVLANTGIRVSELLGARPESIRRKGSEYYLRVMGKGRIERDVPLGSELYRRLKKYADRGRPADARTGRLFVGLRRRPTGEYAALDARGVQLMLKAVAEQAGVRKRVHPHLLRHSYATDMLKRGMNMIVLKENMGHRSLEMISEVYSQLTPGDRHAEYMRVLRAEQDEDE